jgi:hypothetical protein
MIKKYRVSDSFYRNLTSFGKTKGYHLCILSQNLIFFRTPLNLYRGPLCITYLEFELHGEGIRYFSHFCRNLAFFHKTKS